MKFLDTKCRKGHPGITLYKDSVGVSHQWLDRVVTEGMVVIDATAGNGHDTEFLATRVGNKGKVYAFDIQAAAIVATKKRLEKAGLTDRVNLIYAGHENLKKFVACPINAMVFNLGYLPGSNKQVVTRAATTLSALQAGMHLLTLGGLIVLTVYIGHPGGKEEWLELEEYLKSLPRGLWNVVMLSFLNRHAKTSFTVSVQRVGQD